MSLEYFPNGIENLKNTSKKLLDKCEYAMFKSALKDFGQDGCVSKMCSKLSCIAWSSRKIEILSEMRKELPKSRQAEFSTMCKFVLHQQQKTCKRPTGNGMSKENTQPSPCKRRKKTSGILGIGGVKGKRFSQVRKLFERDGNPRKHQITSGTNSEDMVEPTFGQLGNVRVVILERKSRRTGFGFKIQGELLKEMEIVVSQVDEWSIAERAGLQKGDRILRLNDVCCERAIKLDVVNLVKSANVVKLWLISALSNPPTDVGPAVACRHAPGCKQVVVHTDSDGWLGCSIRGGVDYGCDPHVIVVEDGSPAERAGVRKGDFILQVNGNAVKGLPHFQIVRLIITAASPIKLTLKPGSERSSQRRLQSEALPSTPVRNQQRQGPYARCPPLSSTPVQLPGYWDTCIQPIAAQAQQSPSIIPLHTMTLASSPPPPYTAEPLTEHRVLERGAELRSTACSGEHIGVLARSMPLEVDENMENRAESLVMQAKTLALRSQSSNDFTHLNSTHLGEPYTSYNALGNDSHLGDINIRRALSFNDIIDDPVEGSVNTELPTQSQPRAGSILDEIKNFNRQENRAESLVMQDKTLASRSQSSNYLMHLNSTHLGEPYTSYNALGNDSHLGDINIRKALSFNDIIDDPVEGSVNTELPTQSQPRAGSILDEIKNFNRQVLKQVENKYESPDDCGNSCDPGAMADKGDLMAVIGEAMAKRARAMHDALESELDISSDTEWDFLL